MANAIASSETVICPRCKRKVEYVIVKKMTIAGWFVLLACIGLSVRFYLLAGDWGIKAMIYCTIFLFASLIGLIITKKKRRCKICDALFR
jgi:hypothetical protein